MIKFKDNNIEWDPNIKPMFKKFFKLPEVQKYLKEYDFNALFAKANSYTSLGEGELVSTIAEILIKSDIDVISNLHIIPAYFLMDSKVEAIDIEPNIEIIKPFAFEGCLDLKEVNIKGNNLSIIEAYAFEGCKNLKKISFPKSLTAIDRYAFEYCTNLKEVNIQGNNLSIIERYAFGNCNNLEKINFPKSLQTIGKGAFELCYSLHEINYAGTIEELKQIKHLQKMRSIAHVDSSSIFENNIVFHCTDGDVKYSSGIERWKKL